jgi:DNA-binding response OmpR family regulator
MRSRPRILVVDDDLEFTSGVARILDGGGFDVRVAARGAEALQLTGAWQPDVILLDQLMPGLSGIEVVLALRARGFAQPVILATGAGNAPTLADVLGLRHWLGKPFDADELLAVVRATLRERPDATAAEGRA